MRSFSMGALCSLAVSFLHAASAHAEQRTLVDVTYTHSKDSTTDSHYPVEPNANMPASWKAPVDFTKGSVHVTLEVKTKPAGNAETKFQICFIGTPTYACTDQSPTYTKIGKVQWSSKVSTFWSPPSPEPPMDWANGVQNMALILKDNDNNKPAGNPAYMPTDLRVEVTLLSEGSTYVAPPPAAAAGTGGSGGAAAGAGGSGGGSGLAAGSGGSAGRGGQGGQGGAGETAADSGGASGAAGANPPSGGRGAAGTGTAGAASAPRAGSSAGTSAGAPAAGSGEVSAGPSPSVGTAGSSAGSHGSVANEETAGADSGGCRAAGNDASSGLGIALVLLMLTQGRRRIASGRTPLA